MKAVIMAGGSGTRLRPLTSNLPKPMVPVLNKPMAEHIVNLLSEHNFKDIVFTLHYLPDAIKDYFGTGEDFGVNIKYATEEGKPLGTAGCVKAIQDELDSTFLVISGDGLTDIDLSAALAYHKQKKSKATIILKAVENPLDYGVVITDKDSRVQRFVEKPGASEIFSDTVNTGIYILEPEVLLYVLLGKEQDFAKDLFPLLLLRNEPMYGYVANGYWCDIGNLQMYRQAHTDILQEKVKLKLTTTQSDPGIYIGNNCQIAPTVKIIPPVLIGDNCRISSGASIEANSVIGDNVLIQEGVSIRQSIVWSNTYIGHNANLRACVVCNNVTIHNSAEILEGAIIGANTLIGQEAHIKPDVRIWPGKNIDSGSKVTESLIWGSRAPRTLFGAHGIRGIANIEITPEFAVRIAAAYGATLGSGSVLVSRDSWRVSQMITRAIISGLVSVGIEVQNLESMQLPISRYYVKTQQANGLIHVRVSQAEPEKVSIEFFDNTGVAITKSMERKIESTFFKEDFPRCMPYDVGNINFPSRIREYYTDEFIKHIKGKVFEEDTVAYCVIPGSNFTRKTKTGTISTRAPKVVVDYAMAESNVLLPDLLGQLGIDTVVLNSSIRAFPPRRDERLGMRKQLADVVKALNADLGVQIGKNGEQIVLVDNQGQIIKGELLLATVAEIVLKDKQNKTIVIPVNASSAIERIASKYNVEVVRCKASETEIGSTTASTQNVVFGGSANGCFIFPEFQNGYDAMITTGQVIEHLIYQDRSLNEAIATLPPIIYQVEAVHCPWEKKGRIMRLMVEKHQDKQMELLDGVKIQTRQNDWVLILPDAIEPVVHVYADGTDIRKTSADLSEFAQLVKYYQNS